MLQNLVRASGVFVVLSNERTGSLHFARGQLLHAETGELVGDAAALEILSWREGEFINAERTVPEKTTVVASLDALLLRLAKDGEGVRQSEPPLTTATGVRRRMEDPTGFRTTHQGLGMPLQGQPPPITQRMAAAATPGLAAAAMPGVVAASTPDMVAAAAPGMVPASAPGVAATTPGVAATTPGVIAAATPGMAAVATPGMAAVATKAPTRASEPRGGVTNVLVAPHGALIDGNGTDAEALGAKVAYMARLTDLIGETMGAGETRSLRIRTPSSELVVRRYSDGHVSASLGPADPSSDAPPPPSSPLPPVARFP